MSETRAFTCEICGVLQQDHQGWLLVRSDGGADRVSVLRWDERRARERSMHHLCGADHARELVARWVFSGTLCCGAQGARWRVESQAAACRPLPESRPAQDPPEIDLEHLEKAEPETLLAILDAVEIALQDKWSHLDSDDQEVLLYDA